MLAGDRIMGFGHAVYRTEDPRSRMLRGVAQSLAGEDDEAGGWSTLAVQVERRVVEILAELKPGRELHTNVEFYAGVVMELCGLPREMFTPTFAVARVIGWSANVLEQAADPRIIRPSARYVGPPPPQPVPAVLRVATGRARRRSRGILVATEQARRNRGPDMAWHPFDRRLPLRRVERDPAAAVDVTGWPGALPAVTQLLRDGLELGPATVLVGDNGTGKSTLVEAIAMAYGLNAEGGSTHARHGTRASESPLAGWLRVEREAGASRWGYFLRAETMHGFYTYLESNPAREGREARFHELSHGESFLEVLRIAVRRLRLLRARRARVGAVLLGLPGARRGAARPDGHGHRADPDGDALAGGRRPAGCARSSSSTTPAGTRRAWDDLALVDHHRRFLAGPERYLRYVLE